MLSATTTFDFTLALAGVTELTDELANAVYEAGCDDGLLVARNNVVFIDFTRESTTYADAVNSAISSLRSAGFRPKLVPHGHQA